MALNVEKIESILKTTVLGELINTVIFSIFMFYSGLFDIHRGNILKMSVVAGFLYFFIFGFRKYILIEIEVFKSKAEARGDQK